jgi:hypothetical protein
MAAVRFDGSWLVWQTISTFCLMVSVSSTETTFPFAKLGITLPPVGGVEQGIEAIPPLEG